MNSLFKASIAGSSSSYEEAGRSSPNFLMPLLISS